MVWSLLLIGIGAARYCVVVVGRCNIFLLLGVAVMVMVVGRWRDGSGWLLTYSSFLLW